MIRTTRHFLLLTLFFLISCSTQKVAPPDGFPSHALPIYMQTDAHVNQGNAPLYVVIYQLKTTLPFITMNFETLSRPAYQELSTSYVNSTEYYIIPNQTKLFTVLLQTDTHYIGIFADYKRMNLVKWRMIVPLSDLRSKKSLSIHFTQNGIIIR